MPIELALHKLFLIVMSSSTSRIAELAALIAQHTTQVDNYLSEHNFPQPSFNADGPAGLDLALEIEESRNAILRATQELNDLLQHPRDLLFNPEVQETSKLCILTLIMG
jgi:hypothetical protein